MKALKILKDAKALIDKGLWTKGNFRENSLRINTRTGRRMRRIIRSGDYATCYCAAGALRWAAGGGNSIEGAIDIFLKAISKPGAYEDAIWDWNDNKHRTFAHVRNAFARAVKIAQRQAKAA